MIHKNSSWLLPSSSPINIRPAPFLTTHLFSTAVSKSMSTRAMPSKLSTSGRISGAPAYDEFMFTVFIVMIVAAAFAAFLSGPAPGWENDGDEDGHKREEEEEEWVLEAAN